LVVDEGAVSYRVACIEGVGRINEGLDIGERLNGGELEILVKGRGARSGVEVALGIIGSQCYTRIAVESAWKLGKHLSVDHSL
jgi:hypothetical protein